MLEEYSLATLIRLRWDIGIAIVFRLWYVPVILFIVWIIYEVYLYKRKHSKRKRPRRKR